MALEKELATYTEKLPSMANNEGKFVLIHGDKIVDFFVTYDDAIKAGYQTFGTNPFLVKRIQTTEPILFMSRSLGPSRVA